MGSVLLISKESIDEVVDIVPDFVWINIFWHFCKWKDKINLFWLKFAENVERGIGARRGDIF